MSLDLNLSLWVRAAVAVTIFGLVWVTASSVMSLTGWTQINGDGGQHGGNNGPIRTTGQ